MPPRSRVYSLPQELRDALNERLISNGFGGYEALAAWLDEQGYKISKSALHHYGADLQASFETAMGDVRRTTALARAYANSDPDAQAHLTDATARIVQEALLRITLALRQAEDEPDRAARHLAQVSRALADLGRVAITQKRWAQEVEARGAERLLAEAEREGTAGKPLTTDRLRDLMREVYGV